MKVLFVAHSGKISGGANRSLLSVMSGLINEYGIQDSVLIPECGSELEEKCQEIGIPVYTAQYHSCCTVFKTAQYHSCCTVFKHETIDCLRMLKIWIAPVLDRILVHRIINMLPDNFDLVYTNDRMVVIGGYLAKIWKIPHFWHIRSFLKENQTWYAPFYWHILDKYSNRIILISSQLHKTFERYINVSKLALVYNGINISDYSVEKKEVHDTTNLLLTGRIVPPKGQLEALNALLLLHTQYNIAAHLYFAGEIPEYDAGNYYQILCTFIQQNNLDDYVHFLGEVKEISTVRSQMDIELVCSWCEAFGRVTIEAMSAKIPVIGSKTGGTLDIIEPGINGLLYELGKADDLAQKINWIIQNPDKTRIMVQNGYLRVNEQFTIHTTVEKIYSLIEQVVK